MTFFDLAEPVFVSFPKNPHMESRRSAAFKNLKDPEMAVSLGPKIGHTPTSGEKTLDFLKMAVDREMEDMD